MTEELKKWVEKTANVIDQLANEYHYSQACINAKPGDVFFDDSCNYVDLVYELGQFTTMLRGIIRYGELGNHKPEKK